MGVVSNFVYYLEFDLDFFGLWNSTYYVVGIWRGERWLTIKERMHVNTMH